MRRSSCLSSEGVRSWHRLVSRARPGAPWWRLMQVPRKAVWMNGDPVLPEEPEAGGSSDPREAVEWLRPGPDDPVQPVPGTSDSAGTQQAGAPGEEWSPAQRVESAGSGWNVDEEDAWDRARRARPDYSADDYLPRPPSPRPEHPGAGWSPESSPSSGGWSPSQARYNPEGSGWGEPDPNWSLDPPRRRVLPPVPAALSAETGETAGGDSGEATGDNASTPRPLSPALTWANGEPQVLDWTIPPLVAGERAASPPRPSLRVDWRDASHQERRTGTRHARAWDPSSPYVPTYPTPREIALVARRLPNPSLTAPRTPSPPEGPHRRRAPDPPVHAVPGPGQRLENVQELEARVRAEYEAAQTACTSAGCSRGWPCETCSELPGSAFFLIGETPVTEDVDDAATEHGSLHGDDYQVGRNEPDIVRQRRNGEFVLLWRQLAHVV